MAIQDDLSIDWTYRIVDYVGTISADGIPSTIYSAGEVYTYLQGVNDEPSNMKYAPLIEAATPTLYRWFKKAYGTVRLHKAMYAGAFETTDWTRTSGTENGIVQVYYASATTAPDDNDRGIACTSTTGGDDGVLLDFDTGRQVLWIRPDDETAANNFDDTSGTLTGTQGMNVTLGAASASVTGETAYANMFSVGDIVADSEIYIGQVDDYDEVTSPTLTKISRWWTEDVDFTDPKGRNPEYKSGHVDLLIKVQEVDNLIDQGNLIGFCRRYGASYSNFSTSVTGAARSVLAFGTANDLNVTSGYKNNAATVTSGTLTLGELVTGTTGEAIVTAINGTNPNQTFEYYLIGKSDDSTGALIDLTGSLSGETDYAATSGTITNVGPAADTSITVTFGNYATDVDENDTDEQYSCRVDHNSQTNAEVYERLQFLTRRGETGDIDSGAQSVTGELYLGVGDIYFPYDAEGSSGPVTEGTDVQKSGDSSTTGIVTSVYDAGTTGFVVLRQVRGTFINNDVCHLVGDVNVSVTLSANAEAITKLPASPFAQKAGDLLIYARGVVPTALSVPAAEATNYSVTTTDGTAVNPPNKVTVEINGLTAGDRYIIYRVETAESAGSDIIDEDEFTLTAAAGSENGIGDTAIKISTSIPARVPGKSGGGVIRAVDVSAVPPIEHRYVYATWAGQIFTLTNAADYSGTASVADTGPATSLTAVGTTWTGTTPVEVGMIVHNSTDGGIGYVTAVNSDTQLDHTPLTGGTNNDWGIGDAFAINTVVVDYTGSDTAWVPLLDGVASGATENNTLVYPGSDILGTYRVRYSSGAGKILPEQGPATVASGGVTITARRDTDSIA